MIDIGFEVMKKIVGSVLVKDSMVVNSIGFSAYRAVSSLEHALIRLQEWEVDEISVLNLSHTSKPVTDFKELFSEELLSRIRTPLSYGGGIDSAQKAESVIAAGCERVVLSGRKWSAQTSKEISVNIGDQAVLIHLLVNTDMTARVENSSVDLMAYLSSIPDSWGGEIYLKVWEADGCSTRFEFFQALNISDSDLRTPIIVGGGISTNRDAQFLLDLPWVKGLVIGNWLNRDELIVPRLKQSPAGVRYLRGLVGFR